MNKELKINPSKSRKISYVVSFLLVDIMYVVMIKTNLCDRNLGIGFIAFFTLLACYFLYSAYRPKPRYVINSEGIKHNALASAGLVNWEKISEIYICIVEKKKESNHYLGIKYKTDEKDKKRVKFKGKVNKKVGDVIVSLDELDMKPYDAYSAIIKYYNNK